MSKNLIYVSNKGGTINLFRDQGRFLYFVCAEKLCLYCDDLPTAKIQLDRIEKRKSLSNHRILPFTNRCGQALRDLIEEAAAPYLDY